MQHLHQLTKTKHVVYHTGISNTYLIKAISIAIRYSASRLQFKDENAIDELPVLEYQSQQYRLLPHLAAAIIQKRFCLWFAVEFSEFSKSLFTGEIVPHVGTEIHALSSAAKSICTWVVRDAIQDCREATGGHGYLKGDLYIVKILNLVIDAKCSLFFGLQLHVWVTSVMTTTRIALTKAKIMFCCNKQAIGFCHAERMGMPISPKHPH